MQFSAIFFHRVIWGALGLFYNRSEMTDIDCGHEIRFSTGPVLYVVDPVRGNFKNQCGVVFAALLLAIPAFAQKEKGEAETSLPALVQKADNVGANKGRHNIYGQLRLEGMQYLTPLPEAPQLTYSQFLSAQISYVGEADWFENVVDFGAGTFFSRAQSHLAVHELYTSPRTEGYRFYVGRKLNQWSEMDREWTMGIWQPYFEMDALRPEGQGLTGVFFDIDRESFQFLSFATPIFVPSMGPEIHEENGNLVSDSRWYRSPSTELDFSNKPLPISYRLSIPEAAELANHGGYGMMGRLGNRERGGWIAGGLGYAPVNKLILKRNIRVPISDPSVGVIVSPDLTYHKVFSTDVGYTAGNIRATLSYMEDQPEVKLPPTDWAIQRISGIRAFSAGIDFLIPNLFSRSFLLELDYLHVDGGQIQDIGSEGTPDQITLYDQRMKFTNAFKTKVQGELARILKRPLVTKFSWLYDTDQKGSMVNTEFLYYPNQEWAVLMGADFLGVQDESINISKFLNQFRANDRVYGGMTYVF